jgi:hypothetical protein
MKKLIAVFAFLVTGIAIYAQTGPVMAFESTEVDYGKIVQGSEPIRVFKFKNTGTEPLVITSASASCGCTVPNYPKEAVKPGESAKIEVRYDTNRVGPFQKTITITTNETQGNHLLTIKGVVDPKPGN